MRAVAVEAYGSPPFTREHFEYYSKNALEHPYAKHFVETDSGEALRISDLVPVREWTRNPFWKFTLEHLGYRYGLLAVWPLGRNTIFNVDFERRERDFSRRDKHVLDVCMCALGPQYSILARLARRRAPAAKTVARTKRAVPSAGEMTPLTPREDEVLRWVGQGKDNAEIGIILGISPRTAQKHVENILKKLQLENRYAATIYAAQNADGGDSVL
ncbi:MAG: helix-turn-helix transcriptional regulator [Opitutales bacterium]|nr:helix-turn-helix transcriptional regulator [Opitutales bacterium]